MGELARNFTLMPVRPALGRLPVRVKLIMIVDDNARMRAMLRLSLAGEGVEFCECDDGDHAPTLYQSQHPDWVLMDVRMKRVDGLTATRRICAGHPQARVVIVTECDGEEMREEAAAAGAKGFIHKEQLQQLRTLLELDAVPSGNAQER